MSPRYIVIKDGSETKDGFRHLTEDEIANRFLNLDMDKDYFISKNEWMANCIKLLTDDIQSLNEQGPDTIMEQINLLSEEFDRYDLDGNKYIDYFEYKNFLLTNIMISV